MATTAYSLDTNLLLVCTFSAKIGERVQESVRTSITKTRKELIREKQIRWLALNGLKHNITQSPEFAEMFYVYDLNLKPVERNTYQAGLFKMFLSMTNGITKLSNECRVEMHGLGNWLAVVQDIWTSVTKNGILGSSIRLTTKAMEALTIATVLAKKMCLTLPRQWQSSCRLFIKRGTRLTLSARLAPWQVTLPLLRIMSGRAWMPTSKIARCMLFL